MSYAREPIELDDSWPACPRCGQLRLAQCPHCRSTGVRFEAADYDPDGADSGLFMCATCDDVFEPEFFQRCEHCGHDYGHGIAIGRRASDGRVRRRAWLIAGILICGILLLGLSLITR